MDRVGKDLHSNWQPTTISISSYWKLTFTYKERDIRYARATQLQVVYLARPVTSSDVLVVANECCRLVLLDYTSIQAIVVMLLMNVSLRHYSAMIVSSVPNIYIYKAQTKVNNKLLHIYMLFYF